MTEQDETPEEPFDYSADFEDGDAQISRPGILSVVMGYGEQLRRAVSRKPASIMDGEEPQRTIETVAGRDEVDEALTGPPDDSRILSKLFGIEDRDWQTPPKVG